MTRSTLREYVSLVVRASIVGLAVAFVCLYIFPSILPDALTTGFNLRNSSQNQSNTGPFSYNQAVEASAPAVVNVYATTVLRQRTHPLLQDPIIRGILGDQGNTEQRNTNLGSGVIIGDEGYVITNAHVIGNASEIEVTLADGRQTMASLLGRDNDMDLAVLKIGLDNLPSILVGDSDRLKVGDVVLAIGNPYNLGQTVTQGIVSATGRERLGMFSTEGFIQTDADINQGNSGGALIDADGALVGINTRIISSSGGSQGIGLAIPINIVLQVIEQLIAYGVVERGWLGVSIGNLPPDLMDNDGEEITGALVTLAFKGGPAEMAGIMPGDILIEVDDKKLLNPYHASQLISEIKPGTDIPIKILRGWNEMTVQAIPTQRPEGL
jgi:S1-C subfamily serine protease